ncbi:MAG: hypothetical protein JNJ98_03760, partial [Gemmatimonadetes bacterium]|nr:hypothetical protein [Gemmatimonadota bacterium]
MFLALRSYGWPLLVAAACNDPSSTPPPEPIPPALSVPGVYNINDPLRRTCESPRHRLFDFWVGDWSVTGASGNSAGVSRVTRDLGNCVILENFNGTFGRSVSRLDRLTGLWLQDYVDATGMTLRLFGEPTTAGTMAMQDSVRAIPNGPSLASRFQWTRNADGTVQQLWLFSQNGGAAFANNFNGRYAPNTAYQEPSPPTPAACVTRPAYRVLDTLVGRWTLSTTAGTIGTATISHSAAQCMLEERFQSTSGYELRAFLYLDRFIGRWYRTQVDNEGSGFRLAGTVSGATLSVAGRAVAAD